MSSLKESLKKVLKRKLGIDVLELNEQVHEDRIKEILCYLEDIHAQIVDIQSKTEQQRACIESTAKKCEELDCSKIYFGDTLANQAYEISTIKNKVDAIETLGERLSIKIYEINNSEKSRGKIIQIVNVLKSGDAIGDMIQVIDRCLKKNGIASEIYAYENETNYPGVKKLDAIPKFSANDILVFHMTPGKFANQFTAFSGKKILYYHNITPAKYFEGYDKISFESSKLGYSQINGMRDDIDQCIVDSEYNKQELQDMGYRCPIEIINVPINFSKFDLEKNNNIPLKPQYHNITFLYVGRIVPHKKIEDVIEFYDIYRKFENEQANLIIVGSYEKDGSYFQYLQTKIKELGLKSEQIEFKGHITDQELCNVYESADVYVSMSEHEGFCVPIVEAMYFQKVIIAYNAGAVSNTMGDGGILINNKNYREISKYLSNFLKDNEKVQIMKIKQKEMIEKYSLENAEKSIIKYFKQLGDK